MVIGWLVAGTLSLVVLHRPDGHGVFVNPDKITALAEPREKSTLVPGARCVVFMNDRHFYPVTETCAEVRQLLQGKP